MITSNEIASRYGTPVFIYQLDDLENAAKDLRGMLPEPCTLYFSLKANPHPDVVAALRTAGCRAEVSSPGELRTALEAGHDPAHCLLTGPARTDVDTSAAIASGVGLHSVESAHQLHQLDRAAVAADTDALALLRLNPPNPGRGGLRMTGKPSQFGLDEAALTNVLGSLHALRKAKVVGVHVFSATNVPDEDALITTMSAAIDAASRLRTEIDLRYLDLGGGFAAPYAAPGGRPSHPRLAERMSRLLDRGLPGWRDRRPEVMFESGRYLTAGSGTLACRLLDVKQSYGRTFAVADTGVHHMGGLAATGRLLPTRSRPIPHDGEQVRADLVGPLCTPADVLGRDTELTAPKQGDLVLLPNVGAYGLTTGLLGFLGHRLPTEVALRGDQVVSATRLSLNRISAEEVQHDTTLG